ncbi:MAG: steroid delta-isomerase, partial [Flavobacteriaceae bacterium]|nr:steroid delta-isomerase [Flavobacteriaceae bacterium]
IIQINDTISISTPNLISLHSGYNNQPSFLNNSQVLYAGNNKGQSDIAHYSIIEKLNTWVNTPTSGGEYSPQIIPNSGNISAVRLDTTGLQRLYEYDTKTSKLLIDNLQVAYYAFYNDSTLVSSVLGFNTLDLVVSDLKKKTNDTLLINVGRSIHKIPSSKSMSYTAVNDEKNHDIYMLDMEENYESYFICQLPVGIQDYVWLNDSILIIGSGSKLYKYDMFGKQEWELLSNFSDQGFKNITRLAISPDSKRIAIVAEPKD